MFGDSSLCTSVQMACMLGGWVSNERKMNKQYLEHWRNPLLNWENVATSAELRVWTWSQNITAQYKASHQCTCTMSGDSSLCISVQVASMLAGWVNYTDNNKKYKGLPLSEYSS